MTINSTTKKAQVFFGNGYNYRLARVELPGIHVSGVTTLTLEGVTNGAPNGLVLAEAAVDKGNVFDFGTGVHISNTTYALVVSNTTGSFVWEYSNSSTCYPYASPWTYWPPDGQAPDGWNQDIVDFRFRIYYSMGPPTNILDGVVDQETKSGSYWNEEDRNRGRWRAQTFKPTTAGPITSVEVGGRTLSCTTRARIRATDLNGKPTGGDLAVATNTISQNTFTFGTPHNAQAGIKLALILSNESGTLDASGTTRVGMIFKTGSWDMNIARVDLLGEEVNGATTLEIREVNTLGSITSNVLRTAGALGHEQKFNFPSFTFNPPFVAAANTKFAYVVTNATGTFKWAVNDCGGTHPSPDVAAFRTDASGVFQSQPNDLLYGTYGPNEAEYDIFHAGQAIWSVSNEPYNDGSKFKSADLGQSWTEEWPQDLMILVKINGVTNIDLLNHFKIATNRTASGTTYRAQTFVPAMTSLLQRVVIPMTMTGGTTTLSLRGVTSSGAPLHISQATVTAAGGNVFDLNAFVDANQPYALVLSNSGGSANWFQSGSPNAYAPTSCTAFNNPCRSWSSTDSGQTFSQDGNDFYFTTYMSATATTPPGDIRAMPPVYSGPAVRKQKVFVMQMPFAESKVDVRLLSDRAMAELREATKYHGHYVASAAPAIDYQLVDEKVYVYPNVPSRVGGNLYIKNSYDYAEVFNTFNLCNRIRAQEVDEVWIWEGAFYGWSEYNTRSPDPGTQSDGGGGGNPPSCGRTYTTLVFTHDGGFGGVMHSFGHRMEGIQMRYTPAEFWSQTWPWKGSPPRWRPLVADALGYVGRPVLLPRQETDDFNVQVTIPAHPGSCGDVHTPPNIVANGGVTYDPQYQYNTCESWRLTPRPVVKRQSCAAWGCTEEGYQRWWMQNLPGVQNANLDRDGIPLSSIWSYVYDQAPRN